MPDGCADFDTIVRLKICDYINDMADRAAAVGHMVFTTPQDMIEAAELIEHYIQDGGTVSFECASELRKTVRGE